MIWIITLIMLAFSLVNYLISKHPEASVYAAGGFKDFSRIASGDVIMWRDICLHFLWCSRHVR